MTYKAQNFGVILAVLTYKAQNFGVVGTFDNKIIANDSKMGIRAPEHQSTFDNKMPKINN